MGHFLRHTVGGVLAAALLIAGAPAAAAGSAGQRPWMAAALVSSTMKCEPAAARVLGTEPFTASHETANAERMIAGVKVVGHPVLLAQLAALLPHDFKLDESKLGSCRTVDCVAEAAFGRGVGARMLQLISRFGYNASPFQATGVAAPSAQQLDELIAALDELPESVVRADRSSSLPILFASAASNDHIGRTPLIASGGHGVRIYALWCKLTRDERKGALLHEIAHNIFSARSESDQSFRRSWLASSGWSSPGSRAHQETLSQYAATSAGEDFAESFVAYRYAARQLKATSPSRYAFLRDRVFQGVEYTTGCPRAGARLAATDAAELPTVSQAGPTADCFARAVATLGANAEARRRDVVSSCLARHVVIRTIGGNQQAFVPLDMPALVGPATSTGSFGRDANDAAAASVTSAIHRYLVTGFGSYVSSPRGATADHCRPSASTYTFYKSAPRPNASDAFFELSNDVALRRHSARLCETLVSQGVEPASASPAQIEAAVAHYLAV